MKNVKYHSIFPKNFHDRISFTDTKERDWLESQLTSAKLDDFFENPIKGSYDFKHLADIHKFIFEDISSYAGSVRSYGMQKAGFSFADKPTMEYILEKEIPALVEAVDKAKNNPKQFVKAMAKLHTSLDEAHPFREGNGRSTRIFLQQLAKEKGYNLDLTKITSSTQEWVEICKKAIGCQVYNKDYKVPDLADKVEIFQKALVPEKE